MSARALTGGCLCGAVRYEITGAPVFADFCHCSNCRRWSGAAGDPAMGVHTADYRITRGREDIASYTPPGFATRSFCRFCGGPAPLPSADRPLMAVPMGTLDDDPGIGILLHKFVGSKAPWDEITDGLPQFDARPTAEDYVRLGVRWES